MAGNQCHGPALGDVPEWYAGNWVAARASDPGLTIEETDELAIPTYQRDGRRMVPGSIGEQETFLRGWFAAFAQAWNGSVALAIDPVDRASAAHTMAVETLTAVLPLTEQELQHIRLVDEAFAGMEPDFRNVSAFSKQAIDQRVSLQAGPLTTEVRTLVGSYVNSPYVWWLSNGRAPSTPDFEAGVMAVSGDFAGGIPDNDTRELFLGIRQAVGGYAVYDDAQALRSSLSQFIASLPLVSQELAPRPWVVALAGDMGPFNVVKASMLSKQMVANSSLPDFPLRIPSDIIALLVSPDNTTMLLSLKYDAEGGDDVGTMYVDDIREMVARSVDGTDIRSYITGNDPLNVDLEEATWRDLGTIEPVTIVLVLVLIGLYFRSFVASSIPPWPSGAFRHRLRPGLSDRCLPLLDALLGPDPALPP